MGSFLIGSVPSIYYVLYVFFNVNRLTYKISLDFSFTKGIMVGRSDWLCIRMTKMGRTKSDAPKLEV